MSLGILHITCFLKKSTKIYLYCNHVYEDFYSARVDFFPKVTFASPKDTNSMNNYSNNYIKNWIKNTQISNNNSQ